MADTTSTTPSTPSSSAAEQARIRKERREAKIKAGGSARLNKITGLGGNVPNDDEPPPPPPPQPPSPPTQTTTPAVPPPPAAGAQPRGPMSDARLRAMMHGLSGEPDAARGADAATQQLVNGGGGGSGSPSAADDALAPNLWKVAHAVFALGVGLYIALVTTFTGSRRERDLLTLEAATMGGVVSERLFYIFTSVEILLLTTRFLVEKETAQQDGFLGAALGFLPEPWKGYLLLVFTYNKVWNTVNVDAMVCIFVLGVCSWLRGS